MTKDEGHTAIRPAPSLRRAVIIALVSLLWAALLASDSVPQLRGGYGWRWSYQIPRDPLRLVPLVLSMCVYLLGGWWFLRRPRALGLMLWAIAGGMALTLAVLYVHVTDDPLLELLILTVTPYTNGWHYGAAHINDLGATLNNWPHFMQEARPWSAHVSLSPPGPVIFYYMANQVLAHFPPLADMLSRPLRAARCQDPRLMTYSNAQLASAWLGAFTPVWGGLVVLPIAWLGRRLFDEQAARWSILWWPLIPGFLMFASMINTLLPLLATISIALLVEAIYRGQRRWFFAAGLFMSILTFTSLSLVPLLALGGLLALGLYLTQPDLQRVRRVSISAIGEAYFAPTIWDWRWLVRMSLWFGAGLAVIWLSYYLISGVSIGAILTTAAPMHLGLDRPYLPWLILHLYDYFMFTGWPVVLRATLGVGQVIGRLQKRMLLRGGDVLMLATATTLILLDLSGILRGETGRLLQFFTPFVLLAAAYSFNAAGDRDHRPIWILTTGQALMVITLATFLVIFDPADGNLQANAAITPPKPAEAPSAPQIPSGAIFDNTLRLDAFAGKVERREGQLVLVLWLDWSSTGQVDRPYYLSFIPVAPNGEPASRATLQQPFNGAYPTTCWLPRSGPIRERVEVPLFENGSEGEWWVSLALIDGQSRVKLNVRLPDGTQDDQVGIGPFFMHSSGPTPASSHPS